MSSCRKHLAPHAQEPGRIDAVRNAEAEAVFEGDAGEEQHTSHSVRAAVVKEPDNRVAVLRREELAKSGAGGAEEAVEALRELDEREVHPRVGVRRQHALAHEEVEEPTQIVAEVPNSSARDARQLLEDIDEQTNEQSLSREPIERARRESSPCQRQREKPRQRPW